MNACVKYLFGRRARFPRRSRSVLIADLRLPDGDGFQLVQAAREAPRPPPVIIVTGVPSEDRRRAAMTAGAAGFLAKPFRSLTLQQLVQSALTYPRC
jgi:CheY-like chemotaxis protein